MVVVVELMWVLPMEHGAHEHGALAMASPASTPAADAAAAPAAAAAAAGGRAVGEGAVEAAGVRGQLHRPQLPARAGERASRARTRTPAQITAADHPRDQL